MPGRDDSSSDDDEGDTSEELEPKILPKRSSRGVRISDLHGEGDDDFWQQDFWNEGGESDTDYDSESASEDVVDADFDDTEDESDEEEVVVSKERNKRKNVYVDKNKSAKKQKVETTPRATRTAKGKKEAVNFDKSPRKLRKSTRTKATEAAAERKKKRSASANKPRNRVQHRVWTQAERLAEAELTEVINRKSLEDLLRIEELNKRRAMPQRPLVTGPGAIFHSKAGRDTITFTRTKGWPKLFEDEAVVPVKIEKKVAASKATGVICTFSGLPAKYKDPMTGLMYATPEAFATIRQVHRQMLEEKLNPPQLAPPLNSNVPQPMTGLTTSASSTVPLNMDFANTALPSTLPPYQYTPYTQPPLAQPFPPYDPSLPPATTDPQQYLAQFQLLQQQQQATQFNT